MTKRTWSAYHFLGNADAWKALPTEVQQIVERNLTKDTLLRRQDTTRLNSSLADKLQRLRAFYRRWKGEFGDTAWSLLEARAGRPL
jgi:TRAP-type C4-dicarboxylate transport system substrate-binding protein